MSNETKDGSQTIPDEPTGACSSKASSISSTRDFALGAEGLAANVIVGGEVRARYGER